MYQQNLEKILSKIPGYRLNLSSAGPDNVNVSCLFARVRHKRGTDNRPSMSISVGPEASIVYCHTCGYKGTIDKALLDIHLWRVYKDVAALSLEAVVAEKHDNKNPSAVPKRNTNVLDYRYTQDYKTITDHSWPLEAVDFLSKKGCTMKTARQFGCKFLPKGYSHSAFVDKNGNLIEIRSDSILFPVFVKIKNTNECVGAAIRPLEAGTSPNKYVNILRFQSSHYMFGQHLENKIRGKPVVLTEGYLDTMHMWQIGIPALGLNGLSLRDSRLDLLTSIMPSAIILLLDPDGAGNDAANSLVSRIRKSGGPDIINIRPPKDPRALTAEEARLLHPLLSQIT